MCGETERQRDGDRARPWFGQSVGGRRGRANPRDKDVSDSEKWNNNKK